jgi:hypothetical protein
MIAKLWMSEDQLLAYVDASSWLAILGTCSILVKRRLCTVFAELEQ